MPCQPESEISTLAKPGLYHLKPIAALILAAGEASRFGACKQLIELDGTTMLQSCIDKANEVFPDSVFVVTGAYHREISTTIRQAKVIFNPNWEQGIGSSIACGVRAIERQHDAIMILLADQVAIEVHDLKTMVSSFNGSNIVCAHYAGSRGVPALFAQNTFNEMKRLKGNRGAKAILNRANENIIDIEILSAEIDIDTPADLEDLNLVRR